MKPLKSKNIKISEPHNEEVKKEEKITTVKVSMNKNNNDSSDIYNYLLENNKKIIDVIKKSTSESSINLKNAAYTLGFTLRAQITEFLSLCDITPESFNTNIIDSVFNVIDGLFLEILKNNDENSKNLLYYNMDALLKLYGFNKTSTESKNLLAFVYYLCDDN